MARKGYSVHPMFNVSDHLNRGPAPKESKGRPPSTSVTAEGQRRLAPPAL